MGFFYAIADRRGSRHNMKNIEELAQERILILDGAMGTMIQRLGLTEQDFHPPGMEEREILLQGNNEK